MNLDWLFNKNYNFKPDIIKQSGYIPETSNFKQKSKVTDVPISNLSDKIDNEEMSNSFVFDDDLTIIKKSLTEDIQKGYNLLGRSTMKKILKSLVEKIEEEEAKEEASYGN